MDISQANVIELAPVAVRTSTLTGGAVDVSDYTGPLHIILQSSAATAGTTPTLNVKLTECATSGGTYTDVTGATFTEVTDGGDLTEMITVNVDNLLKYVKIVGTIAGTSTPTFGFGVCAIGVLQGGRNASQSI